MRTIRTQLLIPFITIIVLIPTVILIFFNLITWVIMDKNARDELRNTVSTMENLTASPASSDEELESLLLRLSAGLTATKLSGNTAFYIIDKDFRIIFPKSEDISEEYDEITAALTALPSRQDGTVFNITIQDIKYYAASVSVSSSDTDTPVTMLFMTDTSQWQDLIRQANTILIGLLIITVFISVFIAIRITKGISKPIVHACSYAKTIGDGNFIKVEQPSSGSREIIQFYQSLNQMSRRLNAYDTTQKQFLQNTSHELRTPLMSIQGYAEGIENDVLPDHKRAASVIRQESLRISKQIEQLLTLSRIENQTFHCELLRHNITNLLKDTLQRLEGLFLENPVKIDNQVQIELFAIVDEELFAQVLINLLSNAARYAVSRITITGYRQNGSVFMSIGDDGKGFDQEDLPHLFERYYKGKDGNYGLGLAISKSAMEYMNGSLTAYNRDGAVFEMTLPSGNISQ